MIDSGSRVFTWKHRQDGYGVRVGSAGEEDQRTALLRETQDRGNDRHDDGDDAHDEDDPLVTYTRGLRTRWIFWNDKRQKSV